MWLRRTLLLAIAALVPTVLSAQTAGKRYVIVLIGPTGSGKTTQSQFLKKRYGIPTINIDELIKQNPSTIAKYNEKGIDPGTPQTNPGVNDLVEAQLAKMKITKGVVLDGYPATKDQADHLGALIKKFNLPAPIIIQLDVPDNVDWKRLEKRKREDDTPDQIARRLKDYHRELDMARAYYPESNIWTIDGTKSPAEVSKTIQTILNDEAFKKK